MAGKSACTTDRGIIRRWVEERGGRPAVAKARSRGDYEAAPPRIDFPEYRSAGILQRLSWDHFFKKFEEKRLAFVYQERTRTGEVSRFFRFVSRDLFLPGEFKSSTVGKH